MNASVAWRGFIGTAVVQALFYLVFAVSLFLGMEEEGVSRLNGLFPLGIAAVIGVGLGLYRKWPLRGGILTLVVVLAAGGVTFWSIFTPILAVLTAVFWVIAFRAAKRPNPPTVTT